MKKYKIGKVFIYIIKKRKNNFKVFTYETNYVKKAISFQALRFSFIVGISK